MSSQGLVAARLFSIRHVPGHLSCPPLPVLKSGTPTISAAIPGCGCVCKITVFFNLNLTSLLSARFHATPLQVQTKFINPDGAKPQCKGSDKGYFTEGALLDRVPTVFLLLAAIYLAMQLVGCSVIRNPAGFVRSTPTAQTDKDDEEADTLLGTSTPSTARPLQRSPRQAVRTSDFWLIWAIFCLNGLAAVFFSSLWKSMGENYLPSVADARWALAGSIGSLFNAGGRIVWGGIADVVGVKRAIVAHCAISCALYFTLYPTKDLGYAVYFTWICALFFCIGGNFSLFPTATAHAFGKDSFGANYGCIFTSQAVAGVLGGILSSDLVHRAVDITTTTTTTTHATGLAAAPSSAPTTGACPKEQSHQDNYLPALLVVGSCTAFALVLALVFLCRSPGSFLPFEPLASKRRKLADPIN